MSTGKKPRHITDEFIDSMIGTTEGGGDEREGTHRDDHDYEVDPIDATMGVLKATDLPPDIDRDKNRNIR